MKKTYIEPQNVVVKLRQRENLMSASEVQTVQGIDDVSVGGGTSGGSYEVNSRETVISTPDAWDEW